MLFAAATDHRYLDGGHTLDFVNKALEALDVAGWERAEAVLAALPAQLAFAERMEEANAWRNPVDLVALLEAAFERAAGGAGRAALRVERARTSSSRSSSPPSPRRSSRRCSRRCARARRWSSSPRPSRSRPPRGSRASRSTQRVRRLGHGAAHVHVRERRRAGPAPLAVAGARARDPRRGDERPPRPLPERPRDPAARPEEGADPDALLAELPRPARRASSRSTRPAQLVASYLGAGGDADRLVAALGACLLREDRNFHTTQCVEAAARQHELLRGTDDASLPLIAAARYLAAHAPTARSQRQTFEIAQRLHRGERIYEDEDLPPAA